MTVAGVGDNRAMLAYLDRILLAIVLTVAVVAITWVAIAAEDVPQVLEYIAIALAGALGGAAIPKPPTPPER